MNEQFVLISEIVLNNYIAKIYRFDTTTNYVDQNILDSLPPILNEKIYPSDIVEDLQVLPGVSKTEVYDKSNNVLINSSRLVE